LARDIKKKLDAKVSSFGYLILTLSLHYRVKCRGRSLAIDINEFLPSSVYVGSEIINWIATKALAVIITRKAHVKMSHHIIFTSAYAQHVLLSCSTNTSGRRWHHLPTARSVTAWLKPPTRCWCIISVCQLIIFK